MAEENVQPVAGEVPNGESPPMSEQQRVEQEAIARFRESQKTAEEKNQGMPEGYNEDGTEQEELLGGKFKTQDDLLKAYQELEKKIGQPKTEPAETKPEGEKAGDPPSEAPAGVAKYEQEFVDTGSLSEQSYADLAKMGFTKTQVDQYIQGQQFYAEAVRSEVYNSVGGQEQYVEIINWASENMSPATIKEYNDAVNAVNKDKVLSTLEYMKFKKEQAQPRETRRLEGNAPVEGVQPFTNKNDWQAAATNRLYGKDAKYTNMVDQRYLASRKRGIL